MAYATGTITGELHLPKSGQPVSASVIITPNVDRILDTDGNDTITGHWKQELADGAFSIEVPASDDTTLNPHGFTFDVEIEAYNAPSFTVRGVWVPGGATVRLVDVQDPTPGSPTYALQVTRTEFDDLKALVDAGGGGGGEGGAVASVNGETGTVVLTATDVGADPAGSAASALSAATSAAAADATSKASAAQSAAIAAAAADATTKAGNAQAAAISTASADATSKAGAAQTAATAAAVSDAAAKVAAHVAATDPHGDRAWTTGQITAALNSLINSAPGTLDTLGEIAAQLAADESAVAALTTLVNQKASTAALTAHASDTTNPHGVTKAQVGLPLADNTPDASKPVSGPQATAIAAKADVVAVASVSRRTPSSRGRIVFIVDDALLTQRDIAMPKIESVGGKLNFAIPWSSIGQNGLTMVAADVTNIYNRGHQIMCHSLAHPNMTSQTAAQRAAEWDTSKANLEAITAVGAITDFVMPNNASNLTTQQEAYGRYQRVFTAQNAPTLFTPGENGLHLGRNTWGSGALHAQFLAQIRRIAITGETYVIFTHDVQTAGGSAINQAMLNEAVDLATSLGVQFVRADEALVGHAPLVDAGFESGDMTLHAVTVKSGTSTIDIVDDTPMTGLTGTKSLRIVGDGSGQNLITMGAMGIFVPRVEEYTLSGRMRQDKTSGTGGGHLLVRQWDEFGNNLGDSNTTPINTAGTGVTAWAQYTATVTVNKLCRTMSVRCVQSAMVGTTWFDHVHIAPTRLGVLG